MRPQHSEFGFGCPGHRFSKKMPSSLSYDGVPCCFTCSSRTLLACLAAFGAVRFPHAVSLFVGFGLALHVRACPFLPALTNSYRFLCFPTSGFFDNICTIAIPVSIFLPSWEPQVSIQVPQSQPDLFLVIRQPNLFKYRWLARLTTWGAFGGP